MPLDWGSVPDWIASVSASSALTFAALAVRAANKTNRQQAMQIETQRQQIADRKEADREVQLRAQASLVATWYSDGAAIIANSSSLPIFDVYLYAKKNRGNGWEVNGNGAMIVVPPGQSRVQIFETDASEYEQPSRTSDVELHAQRMIEIFFMDATGNIWFRDFFGLLSEADPVCYGQASNDYVQKRNAGY